MSQHTKKDKESNNARLRKQQQQQQQHVDGNKPQQKTKSPGNSSSGSNSSSSTSQTSLDKQQQQQQQQHKKANGGLQQITKPIGMRSTAPAYNQKLPNKQQKEKERHDRESLVLWRRPIQTLSYCNLEMIELLKSLAKKLLQRKSWIAMFIILASFIAISHQTPGPHQSIIEFFKNNTWFVVYWTGLGILSSVGLGTGLHTFILYLGPHIASVTLAAYECNSLNFPQPPYPDDIICPEEPYNKLTPNLWSIMSKVRFEAFLWGAGTALGELPPYFMAKAARLSGYDPEDKEELAEFEALKAKKHDKDLSLVDKGKLFMERVVERIGFFGILACASIPNPLFDLAGITCGHFLVPFWTFFGATLIGKAIIKMHIQKVFVIIAFNETLIEKAVDMLSLVPLVGRKLQEPFKGFLNNQKNRLHRQRNANTSEGGNFLSKLFETFVVGMVCYFIVSIINSLAQSYHKRLHKKSFTTTTSGNVQKKHKKAAVRD